MLRSVDPVHSEPSLYVLSVGISNYRESAFNLNMPLMMPLILPLPCRNRAENYSRQCIAKVLVDQETTLNGIGAAFEAIAQKAQARLSYWFG